MRYTRRSEWSGYTVHCARTGHVVTMWSRVQGDHTGVRVLVPYGTCYGYGRDADLEADHNWLYLIGDIIAHVGIGLETSRILRRGHVVR